MKPLKYIARAISLAVLLTSCAAPNEFYSPDVRSSERITPGTCGNLFGLFRRELSDGVVLEMWPFTFLIRVEGDNSFKLNSPQIEWLDENQNLISELEISSIQTGVFFDDTDGDRFGIKQESFEPLSEIHGTGRYEVTSNGSGGWSPWTGESDIFRVELSHYPQENPETLYLDMPGIYVNDVLVEIEPIKFDWVSKRAMACF